VFCYGSNGIAQLRERCENQALIAIPASLPDYDRVFAGKSPKWGGAVASLIKRQGGSVYGSVVRLTEVEMELLDIYEGVDSTDPTSSDGVYRRERVLAVVDGDREECITYLKNDLSWIQHPSDSYLKACKQNIDQFWSESGEATITVRNGHGKVVSEWTDTAPAPEDTAVAAIFAYGTLRADLSADGDRWGVTQIPGCNWDRGSTKGFALHQQPGLFYPFVVAGEPGSIVEGTVLRWPDNPESFKRALEECNGIEGFNPDSPDDGLYKRTVVTIKLINEQTVVAYMYFQDAPPDLASCESFPDGDWLAARGTGSQ
jgi:gamma-glutamylcyclotransferase (GGCT)/AIG2-like uncharacterized protein YtfP